MRRRLLVSALVLLTLLAGTPAPRVGAATAPCTGVTARPGLRIAMLEAEPAPPLVPGDVKDETLFVLVGVQYQGTGMLWLNQYSFAILTSQGVAYFPQSYSGPISGTVPLRSEGLVGPARDAGWLVFTVPRAEAQNLTLSYQLTRSELGKPDCNILVETQPFTPRSSPLWHYALAARQAFQTYLLDEAQVAGYVTMAVDPVFTGGRSGAASALDRTYLAGTRATLGRDRAAFDRVAAAGSGARNLKKQADAAFMAIENDLATVDSARGTLAWTAWQATFVADNRALADLYQNWPIVIYS